MHSSLALMSAFIITMAVTGSSPFVNRNALIGFETLLVIVLVIVLYIISSRPINENYSTFDILNMLLLGVAVAVDILVLIAVITRSTQGGITPNRLMVIGLNTIFMVHFFGAMFSYISFFSYIQ